MIFAAGQCVTGVGPQLLSEVLAFAERQGYRRITLRIDADNPDAQRIHLRDGFSRSPMAPPS